MSFFPEGRSLMLSESVDWNGGQIGLSSACFWSFVFGFFCWEKELFVEAFVESNVTQE